MPWQLALSASLLVLPFSITVLDGSRGRLRKVIWQPDGRWVLSERNGETHDDARLLPGIHAGSHLLVLHWRCERCRRRFRVALLRDNCDSQALRRLAVRLRLTPDAKLFDDQFDAGSGQ